MGDGQTVAMKDRKLSHRRVRTQPLSTVVLAASSPNLIQDVTRLADIAGVDISVIDPREERPPAVLDLVEKSKQSISATFNELFQPEFKGQHVLVEPRTQPGDVLELFVAAGATQRGLMIGVVGAHGGAGATTLAAMLARQMRSELVSTALIDLDPLSGGYQVLLDQPELGKRWADIVAESGTLLPGRLVAALPQWKDVAVLSGDSRGGAPLSRQSIETAGAVAQVSAATVLDLPRHVLVPTSTSSEWLTWVDHLLVITGPKITDLSTTRFVLSQLPSVPTSVIVGGVKSAGHAEDCGEQLGVDDVMPLRFERTLVGDIAHGMTPGDRLRSGTSRDLARIATRMMS